MRRLSLTELLAVALVLGGCSDGPEAFERPVAEPGQIITVIDENTPEIPKDAKLRDFAVDSDGTLYVALAAGKVGSGRIIAVPKSGKPRILADNDQHRFPGDTDFLPVAVAWDPTSKTLYVLDRQESQIRAIDADGGRRNLARFGGARAQSPGNPDFETAIWLAVDTTSETFYIADRCQVARIRGDEVVVVAGAIPEPCERGPLNDVIGEGKPALEGNIHASMGGIAVDPDTGELLLAVGPAGVFRVSETGMVSLAALARRTPEPPLHRTPDNPGGVVSLGSMVLDPRTRDLYVIETDQRLILRIQPDGSLERIAGNEMSPKEDDVDGGSALETALFSPRRLAVDMEGNVYVEDDPRVFRIRMIGANSD